MISLNTEGVSDLVHDIGADGEDCRNEAYLVAKHFEDRVLVSGYCLSFALCKASKDSETRIREASSFFGFVDTCFVDLCTFEEEFIAFMLSHVRDVEVSLPEQIRDLHEKLSSHNYKDALRT